MTRQHHLPMRDGDFRVRGKEISRIEGLSDAVFGFAITLLAISLEVPKTSHEVLDALRGVGSFAITFFMLFNIWRMQFTYFRRYGIEDTKLVALTAALLFLVLVFMYPLKFIMHTLVDGMIAKRVFHEPFHRADVFPPSDIGPLFTAFGFGFAAVFLVFSAMYRHAYNLREELQLDDVEIFDTLEFIRTTTTVSFIGFSLGISYMFGVIMPTLADPFAMVGSVIVFVVFGVVIRQRKTRKSRRQAVRLRMTSGAEA